ncbi:ABC transporter ATP-binding protein [Luminiphilus syltensis]|uniref:ABC transporter ATP-binding protein n=1 Tax=Luminiphilus syltensis TaxID=1341119 RepID=UPI0002F79E1B
MAESILRCIDLAKDYRDGGRSVSVLSGVQFDLKASERVAIIGKSGAGKSTLLNLLGGLDVPTSGYVEVSGQRMNSLSEASRCRWRNQNLGFVFQFHHLLPEFSAVEAVAMPARIAGLSRRQSLAKARELLEEVGLGDRLDHRPGALSGGERQRVAIARALVNGPGCVLMDEPTGNLDPEASEQVLAMMRALGERNTAFIVVTHDPAVASQMDRRLELRDRALHPA